MKKLFKLITSMFLPKPIRGESAKITQSTRPPVIPAGYVNKIDPRMQNL